jgi:hypothetical protein
MAQILDLVKAPLLEELDMCFNVWDDSSKPKQTHWKEYILAATNGGRTLQRLRIHFAALDNKELYKLLKKLPSLKHLCLENVTFDLKIFRRLKSGKCLPNLEVLELLDPPTSDLEKLRYLLDDFLQNETPSVLDRDTLQFHGGERIPSSVKRLRLVLREPVPLNFRFLEGKGRWLRKDGMEVNISSIPHDTYPLSHILESDDED